VSASVPNEDLGRTNKGLCSNDDFGRPNKPFTHLKSASKAHILLNLLLGGATFHSAFTLLVSSTDTSTCTSACYYHLVKSTDTSTCCHLVYSTDTSACYYHLAVILCIVPTRLIAGACAVRPQQLLCGHIVDFFNFMLPKRRFWKVATTFQNAFSEHFLAIRTPNRVLTPLKSLSLPNEDFGRMNKRGNPDFE